MRNSKETSPTAYKALRRKQGETLDDFVKRVIGAATRGLNKDGFEIPKKMRDEDDWTFFQGLLAKSSSIHEAEKPIRYWLEKLSKIAAGVEIALKDFLQTRSEGDIAGMLVTTAAFISQLDRPDVEPHIRAFRYEHGRHFLLTCARLSEKRLPKIVKATDGWLKKRKEKVSPDEYAVLEQGWALLKATIVTMDEKQLFPGIHDDLWQALNTKEFQSSLRPDLDSPFQNVT